MAAARHAKRGPQRGLRPVRVAHAIVGLLLAWQSSGESARAQYTATLLREAASEREWGPRGLLAADDGKLYVASAGDGSGGAVFSLSLCQEFVPLMTFPSGTRLQHGISEGDEGTFHGVLHGAELAGLRTMGTLFRVTSSGRYQVRHAFAGTDGADPSGPPLVDSAGVVYGVTVHGGTIRDGGAGFGTVYRRGPSAPLTTIFDFGQTDGAQTGIHPASRLVRTADGTLYGTTSMGGPQGGGTVFRLRPDGATYAFELVAAFSDSAVGATPHDLLLARDGNLYGRAFAGQGVIFRVMPQGELSVVHALRGLDGDFGSAPAPSLPLPSGSLMEGADGTLYGVAYAGGEAQQGTLYALKLDGSYTVLHAFSGQREGGHPTSIAQASDGRFFGGVEGGGSGGRGGIYELAPASFDRSHMTCTPSEFVPSSDVIAPMRMLDAGFVAALPSPTYDASTSQRESGSTPVEGIALDAASAPAPAAHGSAPAELDGDATDGDGGCALGPPADAKRAGSSELALLGCCLLVTTVVGWRRRSPPRRGCQR